jgi:nucleoside-diphosphate-sugar epimerase
MTANGDVVVIGGTGFIGKHLVQALVESGRSVRVVTRQAGMGSANPSLRYVAGDVADARSLQAAIAGAETVYHLASGGGERWADFERDFLQGCRNVAEACLQHGVRRLIYTGSIAALYLGRAGTLTEEEGTDPQPQGRALYSRAKILSEQILREYSTRGLPVVILRPGVVVGKGGIFNHSGLGYWASDISCIGWGLGRHPVPFVLVQDVVAALIAACEAHGVEGAAFNLAGPIRPTAREFVALMAQRSHRQIRFHARSLYFLQAIEIGKWIIKCAARKPENAFPSFRDLKSRALQTEIDCSAACRRLGWKPETDFNKFASEAVDSHLGPFYADDLRVTRWWPAPQNE